MDTRPPSTHDDQSGSTVHTGLPVPELLGLLAGHVRHSTVVVVHECRRCGTTLQSAAADCPNCPGRQVATYRID